MIAFSDLCWGPPLQGNYHIKGPNRPQIMIVMIFTGPPERVSEILEIWRI